MAIGTLITEDHEIASSGVGDIFDIPTVEKAIIYGKTVKVYPDNAVNDAGPFEFKLPASDNAFYDLNQTRLNIVMKVLKNDGTPLTANEQNAVVNMIPHALFRQIEVYVKDTQINDLSSPTYPYKVLMEVLMSQNSLMKDTQLAACEGWEKETNGHEETYILDRDAVAAAGDVRAVDKVVGGSIAFKNKHKKIMGKTLHYCTNLHIDFFNSVRYLIPGTPVRLKFIRHEDNFCLLGATKSAKISIEQISLDVRRVTCDPAVTGLVLERLVKQPAIYPICQSRIKTELINQGTQSRTFSQVFDGKLPRSFIVAMVDARGFDGNIAYNPFFFQNFKLKQFAPHLNGDVIPSAPLEFDWTTGDYVRGYDWFLNNIGCRNVRSVGITIDDWKTNSFFLPFDLSPDLDNAFHYRTYPNGTIDFHLNFAEPLPHNIVLIVYASFNELLTIDKDRKVTFFDKDLKYLKI